MPTTYEADSVDGSGNATGEAEMDSNVTYEQNIDGSANPVGEAKTSGPVTFKADYTPRAKVVTPAEDAATPKKSRTAQTKAAKK